MSRTRILVMLAGAGLLLAACADPDTPADPAPPEDTGQEQTEEPPEPPEHTDPPGHEHDDDRVPEAITDAAQRADVADDDVEVVHLNRVTWRDGSIGCPEAGMAYTQALVEGYHLLLEAEGTQLNYHAAGEEDFAFCANPQEPLEGTTS